MRKEVGAVHYKKSVFRSLMMVPQLGLCMITPIFLCIFIGYQADARFGTKLMIPMLILGVLAGARCAWKMAGTTLSQEKKEDERLRMEQTAAPSRTGLSKPKQPSRIRNGGQEAEKDSDRI